MSRGGIVRRQIAGEDGSVCLTSLSCNENGRDLSYASRGSFQGCGEEVAEISESIRQEVIFGGLADDRLRERAYGGDTLVLGRSGRPDTGRLL